MKKKFSVEQIVVCVEADEGGRTYSGADRQGGDYEPDELPGRRPSPAGLEVDPVRRRIKQPWDENARLKQLVAELTLDKKQLRRCPLVQ